jgi:cytochrome c oxidase subunit 2
MFRMRIQHSLMIAGALALAACGGGGSDLSPAAAEGLEVARDGGCTACHGTEGQGGVGPAWQGLMGSQVELEDGSTVTVDPEYIRRSIQQPQADVVAGYTTQMPENDLSPSQIDAIIAYIDELSP